MNAADYVLAGGLTVAGPEKPAIVSGDGSVTYGELALRVSRFAAALREAGMNPGDRVAMLMLDHSDLVALYLAIIAARGSGPRLWRISAASSLFKVGNPTVARRRIWVTEGVRRQRLELAILAASASTRATGARCCGCCPQQCAERVRTGHLHCS
jgi:non-ribosomal peptide synthetase component F